MAQRFTQIGSTVSVDINDISAIKLRHTAIKITLKSGSVIEASFDSLEQAYHFFETWNKTSVELVMQEINIQEKLDEYKRNTGGDAA